MHTLYVGGLYLNDGIMGISLVLGSSFTSLNVESFRNCSQNHLARNHMKKMFTYQYTNTIIVIYNTCTI